MSLMCKLLIINEILLKMLCCRTENICCTSILCTLIVDGVDIKALVYVFFKKTHPRELVSQLTETNMTENLDWHGYIYAKIFFDSSYVLVI